MLNRPRNPSTTRNPAANRSSDQDNVFQTNPTRPRTGSQVRQSSVDRTVMSNKISTTTNKSNSNEPNLPRVSSAARKLPPTHLKDEKKENSSDELLTTKTSNSTGQKAKPPISPEAEQRTIRSSLEIRLTDGGLTGLQNLGNTCFMNSVLQCLSNTKPLLLFCFKDNLSEYLNRSNTSMLKGVLMTEYARLIHGMWTTSSSFPVASPSQFKSTIGRFAPRFLGYAQQDSQEFLRYLLQGLHEDVNRVQIKPSPIKIDEQAEERLPEIERAGNSWQRCLRYDNSEIVNIFAGQLKSTLECTVCHYQSTTFDMFWDLSIPLPRGKTTHCRLQECIQLFMSKEELDGNEKPTCAQCKAKRKCTKKFSIQKCPEILVLHLKRFSQNRSRSKLSTLVEFPIDRLQLNDLDEVMSESYRGPEPNYSLFGVSNHSGTAYFGHYIAQCKHPFTGQWFQFNDSSVHKLTNPDRIVTADAYVLFYERIK